MTQTGDTSRVLRGVAFSKQFPNPAEPIRGVFVADQIAATAGDVDWRVIAPVPWITRGLARLMHKPYVSGDGGFNSIPVARPRYPVLPRRRLYTSVAPSMARAAAPAFARILAEHQPDFVHAHTLYPAGAAAARLVAESGTPLVVTVHGWDLYGNLVRPSWRAAIADVAARADVIVCVSERLRRDVISEIGADPDRCVVIPDAYDDEVFRYIRRPLRDVGPKRLISVGRLVDVKGYDVLVEAMSTLVSLGVDVELTLVGAGPMEAELRERLVALRLADRVRMLGNVSREELPALLGAADLYVLPSRSEGFGVALVEALATGIPAVATRCGGPEDIVDESSGVLVEPGDAAALAGGIADTIARLDSFDGAGIAADMASRFGRVGVAGRLVDLYHRVTVGAPR